MNRVEETTSNAEYRRLLEILRANGHRVTVPRRAMLRLLTESPLPLSVQEICHRVNTELRAAMPLPPIPQADSPSDNPKETESYDKSDPVNLATAYRFANLLVDLKLMRRVEFGQGYYRYEREEPQLGSHHHHLICEQCGRMQDFQGCNIADLASQIERENGFRIERHQLAIYGTCATCQSDPVVSVA